jgi:anti-sigma B factor antagonist
MNDNGVPYLDGQHIQGTKPGTPLTVTVQTCGRARLITLSGEVDMQTEGQFRQAVAAAVDAAPPVLVVDMDGLEFVGSSGLAVLVEARGRLHEHTELRVVASRRATRRPLQLTGLDRALALFDSREQALTRPRAAHGAPTAP